MSTQEDTAASARAPAPVPMCARALTAAFGRNQSAAVVLRGRVLGAAEACGLTCVEARGVQRDFASLEGRLAMTLFEDVHADRIVGTLTMFDRMIFKGHLTRLFAPGAISAMLWQLGFPLTEFTRHATAATEQLTANAKRLAAEAGRPYLYSDRSRRRGGDLTKEDTARAIADRDGITEGVVCVFSVVEPCWSFQVRADHRTHRLEAIRRERKCVHHYLYLIDPEFGFMHVRVQAWIPYEIQIYINGREWLARQLDAAGVGYRRYDNALLSVEDLELASKLCDKLAHRTWPRLLNAFARRVNPLLDKISAAGFGGYYWVLDQAEVATDVMFPTRPALLAMWPDLVRHASVNLSSTDVLRFLGRKLHPALKAEVLTEAKRRSEGWRIKHRMARNWVKVYDKASVLRVETTINNPREFRVLRVQDTPQGRQRRLGVSPSGGRVVMTLDGTAVPTRAVGRP